MEGINALREVYRRPFKNGIPRYVVLSDGENLCYPCLKKEIKIVLESTKKKMNNGWEVVGILELDYNHPEMNYDCAHCYNILKDSTDF